MRDNSEGASQDEYIPVVLGVNPAFHSVSTAMATGLVVFVLFAEHFPDLVPPWYPLLALGRFLSLLPEENRIPLMKGRLAMLTGRPPRPLMAGR